MTKEGEEVPAQEEERRGGASRRKEGRERGAGVPGSRLCSGPRCAEDAPRGTWDIAGLEVQRGARPQPGGVLRLRGFCTAYVLSGAFFSPRRLLFFVSAASPFAAARKIGKLPEEAPSAQPWAPLREASGNRGAVRPETSLATRSADDLARGPGPSIRASGFTSPPRVGRSHGVWLATALPSWPSTWVCVCPCFWRTAQREARRRL